MSVFRVKIGNVAGPGYSGFGNGGGKTVYLEGPHLIKRILAEGSVFTDSNYYKRFCQPQVSAADALLELVSDDGSTYGDGISDNTAPKAYTLTVPANNTGVANILADTGSSATFAQITNTGSGAVKLRLNGLSTAMIDLAAGDTQVFNSGDLSLSKIEVVNTASGAGTATVTILVSVKVVSAT